MQDTVALTSNSLILNVIHGTGASLVQVTMYTSGHNSGHNSGYTSGHCRIQLLSLLNMAQEPLLYSPLHSLLNKIRRAPVVSNRVLITEVSVML